MQQRICRSGPCCRCSAVHNERELLLESDRADAHADATGWGAVRIQQGAGRTHNRSDQIAAELPMSEAPRRRLSDKMPSSPTLIGVGTVVVGNLDCEGDLVVGGSVQGNTVVRGSFTLFEGARWQGSIEARFAVVSGEVEGEIRVSEKLEIRKSARIRGVVSARSIAVAQGAVIEGDLAVTSGADVVRYDEKRNP